MQLLGRCVPHPPLLNVIQLCWIQECWMIYDLLKLVFNTSLSS